VDKRTDKHMDSRKIPVFAQCSWRAVITPPISLHQYFRDAALQNFKTSPAVCGLLCIHCLKSKQMYRSG